MIKTQRTRPGSRVVLISTLFFFLTSGCEGDLPNPAATAIVEGVAPGLLSWSGSIDCCGEDPHPVHGAVLADGAVVMVGKSEAGPEATAGFVTRWRPTDGPALGRLVDDLTDVIEATSLMSAHSALLQVAEVGEVLLAVGFEAESPAAPARGLALVLHPTSLDVLRRLEIRSPGPGESAALESITVTSWGTVVLGGARGIPPGAMEGFKSYGNIVGGRGHLLEIDSEAWLSEGGPAGALTPADLGAAQLELPEVVSVKSIAERSNGELVAVGSDPEERSGLLLIEPGLAGRQWYPFSDGHELTDVAVLQLQAEEDSILLSGHGGDGTIDGHIKRVSGEGEVLWSRSFGNPGVAEEETPSGGLAPDDFIFDECWGVAQLGEDIVVACGTGIEGCGAVPASPSDYELCRADPRRTWRSYLVGLDSEGEILWSRAESFVNEVGEAAESAAEFVMVDDDFGLYAVVDQNFGVGLARLGPKN